MYIVREKRESWRVKAMETQGSLVERVMAGEVEGRQPRGRPRKQWKIPFKARKTLLIFKP